MTIEETNDWKNYEGFVCKLQKAIIESDKLIGQNNIIIERNKKLIDGNGIEREIDLYWEYSLGELVYKTAIECKDYNRKIGIEKIDALIGKMKDLPTIKPVFATKIGYQVGAIKKAEKNGVELLIVREQNDSDWFDKNGIPYIKTININMILHSRISITAINPLIDKDWFENESDLSIDDLHKINIQPIEMDYIEDADNSKSRELIDYLEDIDNQRDEGFGGFEKTIYFENAVLVTKNNRIKIKQIKVKYIRPEPFNMPMTIDYSNELIGVIEYLSTKKKVSVFKNGKVVKE